VGMGIGLVRALLRCSARGSLLRVVALGAAGAAEGRPRRAEVIAALSLALDLGLGQPMEHMLRSAIIACRLADRVGLQSEQRAVVYYCDLLAWIGCHADSYEVSAVFGDDIGYRAATYQVDLSGLPLLRFLMQHVAEDRPVMRRGMARAAFMMSARRQMTTIIRSHHESAGQLADRLGMGPDVRRSLGYFFERWDGTGLPDGAAGEQIPMEMRIVHLADVVEVLLREQGTEGAVAVARKRAGTQFDPEIVTAFERWAPEIVGGLPPGDPWQAALNEAPDQQALLGPDELDNMLVALGDFVDLRSPHRHGHSRRVARLAAHAASGYGLAPQEVRMLARAGLVHDVGRLGVSNAVWNARGPLSSAARERMLLYPYLTQRIVGRISGLSDVAVLAGLHRERLDGSGYPKGVDGSFLPVSARILAASDVYQSLTESRSFRAALKGEAAAERLRQGVREGTLDQSAVEAVLKAAGQEVPHIANTPSALTARELEILRMVAVGRSSRQVARELVISEKTVRNHLEHIYAKVGVTNRVSASMFALQHGIVRAGQVGGAAW
jgi:HD-GYP domain-containing protein (c-di-GMP phosphodiesterase class II)